MVSCLIRLSGQWSIIWTICYTLCFFCLLYFTVCYVWLRLSFFIQYKHISVLYISFRTSCYIYFYIISVSHEFIEYVFNNRSLYICIYIYIHIILCIFIYRNRSLDVHPAIVLSPPKAPKMPSIIELAHFPRTNDSSVGQDWWFPIWHLRLLGIPFISRNLKPPT